MIAVIDTSALMRLFIPDGPVPDGLADLARNASVGRDAMIAPDLMSAEAVQVLHKKRGAGLLSSNEFKEILKDLLAVPVKFFSHKELLLRSAELAHERKITVYDALFLSLAETKNAHLITADHRLGKVARAMGLSTIES